MHCLIHSEFEKFQEPKFFNNSQKTQGLRDSGILAFFYLFIYESILIKISMNKKTQFFYKMKKEIKGHSRSQKSTILSKNSLFLTYIYYLKYNHIKTCNKTVVFTK